MSTSALPPTAPTTLVILLGASAWPNSPGFQASQAFVHAAHGFRDYLLDPHGFGLPAANLLDLFDTPSGVSDQLEHLGTFLQQQSQSLIASNKAAHDVLVYFVGHGGFVGSSHDFYLMPRRANAGSLRASGLSIDALADVLREQARQMRRYLLLDCCFAAAAFRSFLGGPDQAAIKQTLDAFAVKTKSRGFPRRGTVLLCSSDQKSPSLLLPDESGTMFSHALLDVLRNGDLHRPHLMSLRDIKELAEDRLVALPERNAPRPGLYSPDQSEGDVADVPLFPNVRAGKKQGRLTKEAKWPRVEDQTRKAKEEEQVRRAEQEPRRQAEAEERVRGAEEERSLQTQAVEALKRIRTPEAVAALENQENNAGRMSLEEKTSAFFGRPSIEVVEDFSDRVYEGETLIKEPGKGKIIEIEKDGQVEEWRVTGVQAYSGKKPTRIWGKTRHAFIMTLSAGDTITYTARSGALTFIKTIDADNIEILQMENVQTRQKLIRPSHVSQAFGLSHRDRGRLTMRSNGNFRFSKN